MRRCKKCGAIMTGANPVPRVWIANGLCSVCASRAERSVYSDNLAGPWASLAIGELILEGKIPAHI